MGMTYAEKDRELSIALSGEVDHHHARGMMVQVDREMDMALPRRVTLDLGGVTFMDSSGIAVVLRVYKRARELGGEVTVRDTPPHAAKVLLAAGLDKLMKFE